MYDLHTLGKGENVVLPSMVSQSSIGNSSRSVFEYRGFNVAPKKIVMRDRLGKCSTEGVCLGDT